MLTSSEPQPSGPPTVQTDAEHVGNEENRDEGSGLIECPTGYSEFRSSACPNQHGSCIQCFNTFRPLHPCISRSPTSRLRQTRLDIPSSGPASVNRQPGFSGTRHVSTDGTALLHGTPIGHSQLHADVEDANTQTSPGHFRTRKAQTLRTFRSGHAESNDSCPTSRSSIRTRSTSQSSTGNDILYGSSASSSRPPTLVEFGSCHP